jgi:hypothetical protein
MFAAMIRKLFPFPSVEALSTTRNRSHRRASSRPSVEILEDRCLLSTVINLNDSGPGSLRQAIADTPIAGTVDFQEGLSGTISLTSAPLTINKILTIAGPGASVITVSGNHARQVFNTPAPFTVTISGLTIANGNAVNGGGIANGGALTITSCTLSGNSANGGAFNTGRGGGIYNTGTLTITGCTLSGNSAMGIPTAPPGGQGGGIYSTGTLRVTNSTLRGNSAFNGGQGGGIYSTSTVTVTSSTLISNSATATGGGIWNSGNLTVTSSTLSDNSNGGSGDGSGGGILSTGGTMSIANSTLSSNSATGSGGGINIGGGNATIASSTFSLNAAVTGAGISHRGSGTVTITSSTFNRNFASNQGGGLFHTGGGRLNIGNTILAGNSAAASSPDVMGALNSQGHNLIGDGTGGSGYDPTDLVGTAAMPINPLLGPLQDNGGPTQTMELLAGSPALNAGDPAQLGVADQRSVVRSGGVNIGAYQASPTAFRLTAPTTATAGTPFDVTIQAVDPYGKTAIGYTGTVTFTSADPYGATLPPDYMFTTGDNGVHTFPGRATLYTVGTWDVTATDTSTSSLTGSASVSVSPAAADHLLFLQQPTDTAAGQPITPAVTVAVVDQFGNTITSDNSDAVTLAIGNNPGGGTLRGTLIMTVSSGVATFSDLSIDKAGSGYTLVASSAGLTGTTSVGFAITAAAADHLVFLQQPTNTTVGQTISPVMVAVVDQFGNIVTSDNSDTITLSLNPNPSGGMLRGTLTVTVVNGIATFNDLSIDLVGDGYTLHARVAGLMDADSAAFSITP